MAETLGNIVILNGAPRSGKSSIARAVQESFDGIWINLGVDRYMTMIPQQYQPGIGLRPGGERPDLEPMIATLYEALYQSIAAHSRLGVNVVVDVGHHDAYDAPRGILPRCARILHGLPALLVGVRCPLDVIMARRAATGYPSYLPDGSVPRPVRLWQEAVHTPGLYDMEVDTSVDSPEVCAAMIRQRLDSGEYGDALRQLERAGV